MKPFELRTLPLESLREAEYNPRRMAKKAREKLKASLETFGLVEPLIWNERSGRVVGGHQRLSILREMNVSEAPVSVVNLNDADEKALNIMLNNLEAQGRYDPTKLAELLTNFEPLKLLASGFDENMMKTLNFAPVPELGPSAEDEVNVEITLKADAATYSLFSPRLDELIREFELESHVKMRP